MPKLTNNDAPLQSLSVLGSAAHRRHREHHHHHDAAARAISCRRSGRRLRPSRILGWGKTTQLGYGLGLAMGAKLAKPDKLCINVWGDAAIGFTGMDFRDRGARADPNLSILLNNFSMAIELKVIADLD